VCLDTGSGTGFCAEHSAIAALVTAGELHVAAPCGRCREFMRQVDEENMHAEVVLDPNRFAFLRDLLPESAWPADPVPGETRSRRRS